MYCLEAPEIERFSASGFQEFFVPQIVRFPVTLRNFGHRSGRPSEVRLADKRDEQRFKACFSHSAKFILLKILAVGTHRDLRQT